MAQATASRSEAWPDGGEIAALTDVLIAQAVAASDIAVWQLDLATDQVTANQVFFRLLGLPFAPEGVPAARVRALQHPEDQARAAELTRELLAQGQARESQLRYLRADGRCLQLLSRRSLLRDAQGQARAILGVTLDVTERHAQEQRASESARRFQMMAREAGIGWWSVEGEPAQVTWSDELRRMVDLMPGEAVPDPRTWVERFVHPDDRAQVRQRLRVWRRERQTRLDFSFRLGSPQGTVRDIASHAIFEPHGATPLRFGMLIDVTERRQAARRLQEARERAALAVDGAGIGTWEWRSRDNSARWDENMFRLRGLPPRAHALEAEERMALVHPDDREFVQAAMARAAVQREPLAFEFRVVWPDGQVRWLASRSVDLPDAETGELRRIGANWDVTDRRRAEQSRRDAEVALRESQAKSRFMARMSHELRTPLNAVLGFAQLLLLEEPLAPAVGSAGGAGAPAAPERSRRAALEHIQRAGQHLLELINDVLDLARIEGGEMTLARAPVALQDLVRETLPLVAPLAQAREVQLRTGALDLAVLGDATRLRQVLLNLLSNGIKYNRAGGEVVVEAAQAGSLVHLRVRDSGRGIPGAQLAELFQPFNRLGAEREAIEGTGIGLAIVRSLVEHMGGHVQVTSEPGRGSVFEVVLPHATDATDAGTASPPGTHADPAAVSRDAAAPPQARPLDAPAAGRSDAPAEDTVPGRPALRPLARLEPQHAPPPRKGARRVLYIEDNDVNALIVREALATVAGFELTVATDGASGVVQAQLAEPELVLLDMQLPDMDGFEVLRRLREHPRTAALPVVALSANALPEQVSRGLAAGLLDYWTKPLDVTLFVQRMVALLPPPAQR